MGKYLTLQDRYYIEFALKENKSVSEIALNLGKCRACIYNEIKRGQVEQMSSDLIHYYAYSALKAQNDYECKATLKGRDINLGNNYKLAEFLENEIIIKKSSPYAALENAKRQRLEVNFCLSSFYSYIHKKVFLNLTAKNLKKYHKNKEHEKHQHSTLYTLNHSIEKRDKRIKERQEFGHWEADTVVGKKGTLSCCLVLTERKTRFEIIRKITNKSVECVLGEFDKLEEALGEEFKDIFKTVTSDNGVEFLGNGVLERSINGGKRFDMYYCHPYCSSEKGSVENANRLVRKYIKKSQNIDNYDFDYIRRTQDAINNYPRKLFNGFTSSEQLKKEIGFLFN